MRTCSPGCAACDRSGELRFFLLHLFVVLAPRPGVEHQDLALDEGLLEERAILIVRFIVRAADDRSLFESLHVPAIVLDQLARPLLRLVTVAAVLDPGAHVGTA